MSTQIPAVAHFAGSTPAFSAEQEELLRAADQLRIRLKRAPRLTELLQLFQSLGYRRLSADLMEAFDAGRLRGPQTEPGSPEPPARAAA